MTYLFLEGFESDITPYWRYAGASFANATEGRLTGSAESISNATAYSRIESLGSNLNEGCIGVGIKCDSAGSDDWAWVGFGIANEVQLSLRVRKSGSSVLIQPFLGSPGLGLSVGTEVTLGTVDQWYFVQIYANMLGAGGAVQVVVDEDSGSPVIDLTGVDATYLGNPGFNSIHFHTRDFVHFDDLHVWDATGVEKYGDALALVEREANAAGDINQWAVVGGATAHEVLADEDENTYISSSTTNDQALVDLADLGALADVVQVVQVDVRARTGELGFRGMKAIAKEGGSVVDVENDRTLASTVSLGFRRVLNTKPSGGAWTQTAFDDLQIGVELL